MRNTTTLSRNLITRVERFTDVVAYRYGQSSVDMKVDGVSELVYLRIEYMRKGRAKQVEHPTLLGRSLKSGRHALAPRTLGRDYQLAARGLCSPKARERSAVAQLSEAVAADVVCVRAEAHVD
eukprot:scaffold6411_cov62-Phaeocystis_antarctica.AAC.2